MAHADLEEVWGIKGVHAMKASGTETYCVSMVFSHVISVEHA
jgi:hypothetical protein